MIWLKLLHYVQKKRILSKMNAFGVFSILVDETKDASKKEQLSFIIIFIDKDFCIHEKTLDGFHMLNSNADFLCQEIQKIVTENNLNLNMCVAQCYDGASVISGMYSGISGMCSAES